MHAISLTPHAAIIQILNEGRWRDDEHRTETLRPFLRRLEAQRADPDRDQRISYALADYAVRVCAAEALESVGMSARADALRELAPIVDRATADVAYAYASYVSSYVSSASYAASYAASATASAATSAAYATSASAAFAAYASSACTTAYERYARALLTIVVETT
jgi:hypothetical protein